MTIEEIAKLVLKFMEINSCERKGMSKRALQVQEICRGAITEGGSSDTNLNTFIQDILQAS